MDKQCSLNLKSGESLINVSKALSNKLRIQILQLLAAESLSVNEIANKMGLPLTTIASNINVLEESGLINCILQAGKHGTMKLCYLSFESINLNFISHLDEKITEEKVYNVPLGSFFSAEIEPTCGMADEHNYIGKDDDITSFYSEKRINAQLIWFLKGFLEYRIPFEKGKKIEKIEISMELCSEAPGYRTEWPSDITLYINDIDIGTFTCPGDFGGRRGRYSPDWWSIGSTQFGVLKCWQVNDKGSFLDYSLLSNVTIDDIFNQKYKPYLSFKIGVKKDAKNIGGLNIFGEKFGDHPIGIVVKVTYKND